MGIYCENCHTPWDIKYVANPASYADVFIFFDVLVQQIVLECREALLVSGEQIIKQCPVCQPNGPSSLEL